MAQGLLVINYCRATTNLRPRNGGTLNAFRQGHIKLIFKKSSIILLCMLHVVHLELGLIPGIDQTI